MTTSIYKAEDNSMHEQAGVTLNWRHSKQKTNTNCRVIECARPHSWVDGKEYELGKDYYIGAGADTGWKNIVYSQPAVPLHQSNDEDELQWDCFNEIGSLARNDNFTFYPEKFAELKSKFHITRKPSDK